jgi:hypothetical protein
MEFEEVIREIGKRVDFDLDQLVKEIEERYQVKIGKGNKRNLKRLLEQLK